MFLDLINLNKIRRAILYLFVIGVTMWLQTMLLARLTILGVKPFFVPVVAVAIGLWEGGVWGCLLGLITGLSCDLALNESVVTFLVLFSAYGFFSGVLAEHVINRRFLSYLILAVLALLLTALIQIVPHWIFRGVSLNLLLPIALLQTLWSIPFAVPAYFACKAVSGKRRLS